MNMEALAIIPARGGSKRLLRKNMQLLGGQPLVCHTLDAVQESDCFSKALLSSDDAEILSLASKHPIVEASPRPEELSGDQVTALTLVNSIVSSPEIHRKFEVVALLLPTAPFRQAKHLQEAFAMLNKDIDGIVSLTTYEFPPQLSVTLQEGVVQPVFEPCPLLTGNTRSQDQAVIYRPNGAFYIQWMERFLVNQNFWKGKVKGYVMDRMDSVDIDNQTDLEYAEFLMQKRGKNE
jgi:CMP-N-acetylneuraminic acid synthetase